MTSIDMDPEGMASAMDGLEAAGARFGDAWATVRLAIGAAGGLGMGPMGKAFTEGYQRSTKQLTPLAEGVEGGLAQAVEAGRGSAAAYKAADAGAANGFGK